MWEDNIRMNLREIGLEAMDRIHLLQTGTSGRFLQTRWRKLGFCKGEKFL